MPRKRILFLAIAILGAVMMIYAISSMRRIAEAKGDVGSINRAISGSSVGRMVGGDLSNRASQYDTEVMVLLIAGIAFVIVGCGGAYRYRKMRK